MNTLTKFAVALPTLALLSACATTAPTTPNKTPASESVTDVAYDRMAPAPYTCTDGSKILAKQPIILNGGVQGDTASYVNESNSEVVYAWHMKGDKGIFAMKWADGKEYQVNCQI